jgi:hypothetical protein
MDLRKFFEENNSDDAKILPRDAMIKLAYHTSDEVSKKYPSICDPNKLRHTKLQLMSFSGPTKTNKIIFNKEIQLKNFNRVKEFIVSISKTTTSPLQASAACKLFSALTFNRLHRRMFLN